MIDIIEAFNQEISWITFNAIIISNVVHIENGSKRLK